MKRSRLTLIGGCLAAVAVVSGHYWGLYGHYPGRPPTVYTYIALIACGLMFLDLVSLMDPLQGGIPFRVKASMLGSSAYAASVVVCEPFLLVHHAEAIVNATLVLLPMVLAIIYLVRLQVWVSAGAMSLFVLACSAMLASNFSARDSGSGFFSYWIS
jgi:hypothetical protein